MPPSKKLGRPIKDPSGKTAKQLRLEAQKAKAGLPKPDRPAAKKERPASYEDRKRVEPRQQKYAVCGCFSRRLQRKCERPAGWGTDHAGIGPCKLHGGGLPSVRTAALRTMIDMEMKGDGNFGANLPVDIHPTDALLELVKMTAGYVRWLNSKVAEEDGILQRNGQTKSDEMSAMIRALGEYTDRLARFSKMALDAGVEERIVRLAEAQGDLIAMAIVDLLDKLVLTAAQKEIAPALVREALGRMGESEIIETVEVSD